MKQINIEVLGVEVPWQVTSDSGEMNSLAGVKDAEGNLVDVAHARALDQTLYHQVYTDLRDLVVQKIVEKKIKLADGSTLEPATEQRHRTKKDGTKVPFNVVIESDSKFVDRAKALGHVTDPEIKTWLTEASKDEEYAFAKYLVERERHVKVKKLPKAIEEIVAKRTAEGTLAQTAERIAAELGRPVNTEDPTEIGWAIKEYMDKLAAQALSKV